MLLCLPARAQEHLHTRHATMFGAGWMNNYDTYLSPLEYKGWNVAFIHETFRMTHWKNVSTQGVWRINGGKSLSPAGNRNYWAAQAGYEHLWHYNWHLNDHWTLRAGGGIEGYGGFLYSSHGGNNPAQGYVNIAFEASVSADYKFRIGTRHFTAYAQLDAPFLGMMYSPRYMQPYYMAFGEKGRYDHNVVCTGPWNAPTLRGCAMIDMPIASYTVRFGYAFNIVQATPNNLRHHMWTHAFMIGWVKHFHILKKQGIRF